MKNENNINKHCCFSGETLKGTIEKSDSNMEIDKACCGHSKKMESDKECCN